MKNYVRGYILENYKMLIMFVIFLIIGIVAGIVGYQMLDITTKTELINSIKSTLEISKEQNFEGFNIIKNGMISNILLMIVIYFTAVTLICPYLLGILNVSKGFAIGIYIPTLLSLFGVKNGALAIILMVILPNLMYIPSFIYSCVNSCNISREIISSNKKISIFVSEVIRAAIAFSIIFVGIIIEQMTSTYIISLYSTI